MLTQIYCADCGCLIGHDNGPRDGWQLEDKRVVCHACCVKDLQKIVKYVIGKKMTLKFDFYEDIIKSAIPTKELKDYIKRLPDEGEILVSIFKLKTLLEELVHYREKKNND